MDEPGDAPVTIISNVAAKAEPLKPYILPAIVTALGLFANQWFNQFNQTQNAHGVAIEAVLRISNETHEQMKAFRTETAEARVITAHRLEAIEEETSRKLEAIREENRNLSNQIKEIEPRVKEIEQKVKAQ